MRSGGYWGWMDVRYETFSRFDVFVPFKAADTALSSSLIGIVA